MGSGASSKRRYRVQTASRAELCKILQDISKDTNEEDISEDHRQLLLRALQIDEEEKGLPQKAESSGAAHSTSDQAKGISTGLSTESSQAELQALLKQKEEEVERLKEELKEELRRKEAQQEIERARQQELAEAKFQLYFTLQDKPAIQKNTGDISYAGEIKPEATDCYVSFPGKFAAGWDALIKEEHGQSVACVFLSTPESGLGQHHPKDGTCWCPTIYGERDFKTFGYLQVLPDSCTADEEARARQKAEATKTVVIRADASEEDRKKAEELAMKAWEANGRTASWGCAWFEVWKNRVQEAVRFGQSLKAVFFPGQVGEGKIDFDKLPDEDLWNNIGCGGSQKSELAFLDRMKKEKGDAWSYSQIDVSHFLKSEFRVGKAVDALDPDTKQWCRGTLLEVPLVIPRGHKEVSWKVQSHSTGKIFVTDHIRHADLVGKMLAEVGEEDFIQLVEKGLPHGLKIVKAQEYLFPKTGTPSLAMKLRINAIELLQQVRDVVLGTDFEIELNKKLARRSGEWQIKIDKTYFAKSLEKELLKLAELTAHQKEKLQEVESAVKTGHVHLSAPAGAGKTFVAVQHVIKVLKATVEGQILFVSPSICLGLYFLHWLLQGSSDRGHFDASLLHRVILMEHPYEQLLSLELDGNRLVTRSLEGASMKFLISVLDEAHEIFGSGVDLSLLEQIDTKQRLLLSSESQTSSPDLNFPSMRQVQLKQIVRSTKRIMAGAAAFQASDHEKEGLTSLCPAGPALKTFIFESDPGNDQRLYRDYATHTVAALWYVARTFAGLSFNKRLALLVPTVDFLDMFKPVLAEALKSHFASAKRSFSLMSFEDHLRILPSMISQDTVTEKSESILLDTIDHARGLEQLIIICIGLDAPLADMELNQSKRAQIYQGITRAQLQALVVNHFIPSGWFAFLGLMKFKTDTFDESEALAETTTEAAHQMISEPPVTTASTERAEDPSKQPNPGSLGSSAASPISPDAPAPPADGSSDRKASDVEPQLEVEETSVWDTEGNAISSSIRHLVFDPRSGAADPELDVLDDSEATVVVKSLEALAEAPKDTIAEIDIRHERTFGDAGAEAVAQALKRRQRKVRKIFLNSNRIGPEGAKALAGALKVNRSLKEISLNGNKIGLQGVEALATALKVNQSVKVINFFGNNLGDRGVEALQKLRAEKDAQGVELNVYW